MVNEEKESVLIKFVGERSVSDNMVELDFEYSSKLKSEVAKYFDIEEKIVTEKMISAFVKNAIYEEVVKDLDL